MIKKGQIVEVSEKYFASNVKTIDFDGTIVNGKEAELEKMRGFVGVIAKVNGITLHYTSLTCNISFAEITVDFDMKDGSKILWHEIIRSVWENGLIVDSNILRVNQNKLFKH